MITLKLIKIDPFIVMLRFFGLILFIIPIPIFFFNPSANLKFWVIWFLLWLLLYILQYYFLNRYKLIGRIIIENSKIEINKYGGEIIEITPVEKLRILINYKGHKGQRGDYNMLQIPVFTKEGIGKIVIYKGDTKIKFNFLADVDVGIKLRNIAKQLETNGCIVDYIWD